MKITELLNESGIELGVSVKDKSSAIEILVNLHEKAGNLSDKAEYTQAIKAREEQGSTAVGEGIAIPHAKCSAVKRPGLAAITVPDGVDYEALDGQPSNLFFMIAAPEDGADVHLEVLSRLMVLLMDEDFKDKLLNAKSKQEFLAVIDEKESEKYGDEESLDEKEQREKQIRQNDNNAKYRVLAVTACPTGIAHTYMAAEALQKAGENMGYSLKAETNGSGGVKNALTAEEIEACDGIIVAADKNVETARFDGKPVLFTKVSDGIHKPEELITKIVEKKVPVYHEEGGQKESLSSGEKEGVWHVIYKHLMNGVSHMLPFVVGGGILIAIAFLIDGINVDMNSLSEAERANFGTITPVAALFKNIGGAAFGFMLPVLAGYIAMAIGDRPALALGFVGGYIAANGKSGFLGALVAGFAAGYIILGLRKLCDKLPEALEKIAPVLIYPVVGILVIGLGMNYVIEPVMGAINTGLNSFLVGMGSSSRIILGFVLAAMMAIDMGGPFNKAAYVFGTASIAYGNYDIMAAVMIGGMVPPCAIALATMLFKNKFTKEEREAGPTNFIMGLAFITEGAIPYAAADPLHVIPACLIGSGIAGAISMLFKCTLMAPHGGIFVFPVVGNPLYYLLALVVGTIVSCFLLGVLKKKVNE